jgi:hypothetical protein|tara:strand:+ start:334 stop:477 length:144 start_codon:yes stop_codon:yes gene_type:complete
MKDLQHVLQILNEFEQIQAVTDNGLDTELALELIKKARPAKKEMENE